MALKGVMPDEKMVYFSYVGGVSTSMTIEISDDFA
jgi:hypothetical protein